MKYICNYISVRRKNKRGRTEGGMIIVEIWRKLRIEIKFKYNKKVEKMENSNDVQ